MNILQTDNLFAMREESELFGETWTIYCNKGMLLAELLNADMVILLNEVTILQLTELATIAKMIIDRMLERSQ